MKAATPTTSSYIPQRYHSDTTNILPTYNDQSHAFNTSASGVDFNLDFTQFYIHTNESDFMNSDELKTDFNNGMIHFSPSQFAGTIPSTFQDKVFDDNFEFSALDLSNGIKKVQEDAKCNSSSFSDTVDGQLPFAVINHSDQSNQIAEHSDTKISVSTPLDQFYLDFKVNGEVIGSSIEDHSVVTYISKEPLQSVEYINENGQTETVMYVNPQPDGSHDENNGDCITQYEIINLDNYQYQNENVDSVHPINSNELVAIDVPNIGIPNQLCNEENLYAGQQTNILSTLLADKNNKITIIAKPLKNPKVRRSSDELYLKFDEIDNNPTNIAFAKMPKGKGGRKQKLETINQTETEVVGPKRTRPKVNDVVTTVTIAITETPKLPSKFMRDRRNKMQTRQKRPRKICWDSESDCENVAKKWKSLS